MTEPGFPSPDDPEVDRLARVHGSYAQLAETIDAYRASLLARGYSAAAAEQMTVDFHRAALGAGFARAVRPPAPPPV